MIYSSLRCALRFAVSTHAPRRRTDHERMNSNSLEIQLAELVALHGREPVIKKLRSMTAKKVGRPRVLDWEVLWDVLEEDAADIIRGRDPLLRRTNTSIAKQLARANPMQSPDSTSVSPADRFVSPRVGQEPTTLEAFSNVDRRAINIEFCIARATTLRNPTTGHPEKRNVLLANRCWSRHGGRC